MNRWSIKLSLFLIITTLLSAAFWWKIITAGTLGVSGGLYVLALMWCPGIAALLSRLILQRDLRGQGWALWRPRALVLAYLLPVAYALPVYIPVWLTHLGIFAPAHWAAGATMVGAASSPAVGLALAATLGVVMSLLSAAGEEIGWRGYLVPVLAERLGTRATVIVSSLIWAAWHMPLIIFADYGAGTPLWWGIPCFVAMILGLGIILGWLRLTSGSLWPAALLHASHNLFVEGVFDGATTKLRWTHYATGEFGIGLAITIAIAAWLLAGSWLHQRARR
ncbi:MAG: type II CAAX endopeptidase family protein [Sphingomonas sp.]